MALALLSGREQEEERVWEAEALVSTLERDGSDMPLLSPTCLAFHCLFLHFLAFPYLTLSLPSFILPPLFVCLSFILVQADGQHPGMAQSYLALQLTLTLFLLLFRSKYRVLQLCTQLLWYCGLDLGYFLQTNPLFYQIWHQAIPSYPSPSLYQTSPFSSCPVFSFLASVPFHSLCIPPSPFLLYSQLSVLIYQKNFWFCFHHSLFPPAWKQGRSPLRPGGKEEAYGEL